MSADQGSKIPTVIGTLSVVFCSFGILNSLLSTVSYSVLRAASGLFAWLAVEADASLVETLERIFRMDFILSLVRLAAQGVGLAGGICLLMKKKVGVVLSDIYAGLAMAVIVAGIVTSRVFFAQLGDEVLRLFASALSSGDPELAEAGPFVKLFASLFVVGMQSASLFGIFGAAYPIVVLSLVNLPKVRKGFEE